MKKLLFILGLPALSFGQCNMPAWIGNNGITSTSIMFDWGIPNPHPQNGYQYAVTGSSGFPSAGTSTSGTSATVSGLTPSTNYLYG